MSMTGTLSTLEYALVVLCIEFGLGLVTLNWLTLRKRRRLSATVAENCTRLSDRVASNEASRRQALAVVFETTYGIGGDRLEAMTDEFLEREKAFYRALIGIYRGQDGSDMADLSDELNKVVAPWVRLSSQNAARASEAEQLAEVNSSLEATNSVLQTDLDETRDVLEKMMNEYRAAFDKEGTQSADQAADPPDSLAAFGDGEPAAESAPATGAAMEPDDGSADDAGLAAEAEVGEHASTASDGPAVTADADGEDDEPEIDFGDADELESRPGRDSAESDADQPAALDDDSSVGVNLADDQLSPEDLDELMNSLEDEVAGR